MLDTTTNISLPHDSIPRIVVIGAGVGGPQALTTLLSELPADYPGTVIITTACGKGFSRILAQKLNTTSLMSVSEAVDGQLLRRSRVYLVPSDCIAHLELHDNTLNTYTIELTRVSSSRATGQALDIIMESAASLFGNNTIGVVLTSTGKIGLSGARAIADTGGMVVAQDESSCICFDAPGAVIAADLAHKISPLWQITTHIMQKSSGASSEYAA